MGFTITNNMISRGALSGAIVQVPTGAFIGISKGTFSEFGMYACLRLYLVHSHVTDLGGNIAAESTVDEGTTFTITFKP